MNTKELTNYIKNYFKNDKTHSAIMLTGAWGTGKSYYIQNELVPAINTEQDKKCIVISLYGLKELSEISKSIYLEIRMKKLKKTSEKINAGILVGKTILKGVAGFFNIDLSQDEGLLQKLYDSINLDSKLIILEDLERCSINIIELLGFVNNLVEQDGVKVLLVANEDEFIEKVKPKARNKEEQKIQNHIEKITDKEYLYTEETENYLRKKEKTISDTLYFEADKQTAVSNIIKLFFQKDLATELITEQFISDIIGVLDTVKSDNLRAVMFACQKTNDMLKLYKASLDIRFIKFLLCSNIAYSCRLKKGDDCEWKDSAVSPSTLGTETFPLFKVSYDYLKNQRFVKILLEQAEKSYLRRKEIESSKTEFNKYFVVLQNYYHRTETEVSEAIKKIKAILEKKSGVKYSLYGTLANYLIAVRECVDNTSDIDECKSIMLKNIREIDNDVNVEMDIMFSGGIEFDSRERKQEFEEFKEKLLEELHYKKQEIFDFGQSTEIIKEFISYINNNRSEYINAGCFAKNIPINKFIEMLKNCNSKMIGDLRGAFLHIYSSSNIKDFMAGDKETLIALKEEIQKLKITYEGFDKIQKKQLDWFIGNLEGIIAKLS